MTREEFDALIQQLEAKARRQPKWYSIQVGLLAVLGYCYLFFVLTFMLIVTAGLVWLVVMFPHGATIKIAIVIGAITGGLSWAILKALRVRLEAPQGLRLERRQAPTLFAALDDLRRYLQCRPFHEVLVVGDFNAAVVQVPRWGVFGWQRNYLLLGLPLMLGLSPDEFRAVLAHEFAHLSRNHSRFAAWIYRVRRTWERVFEEILRQRTGGAGMLVGFIRWFWPKFNAHAFVLARANEYDADRCSANLVGADTAASALMRVRVLAEHMDEVFWPAIFKLANETEAPLTQVFHRAGEALKAGPPAEATARWLRHSFTVDTSNSDTHPSLRDRLRALGRLPAGTDAGACPSALPPVAGFSAAEAFLGDALNDVSAALSQRWQAGVAPAWKARFAEAGSLRQKLIEGSGDATMPPTVDQLWEKARALIDLEGDAAAVPLLEQILVLDPRHGPANFVRGRHHLHTDDPRGVSLVERAMLDDPAAVMDGCNLLYAYYARTGQKHRLRELEKRVDEHQAYLAQAQQERANVTALDTFEAHEIAAEQLASLRKIFAGESDISSVEIARKAVRFLPRSPMYAICVRAKVAWWKPRSQGANQKLVERLLPQIALPGHFFVFIPEQNLKALGRKIAAVPGALVYQRTSAYNEA